MKTTMTLTTPGGIIYYPAHPALPRGVRRLLRQRRPLFPVVFRLHQNASIRSPMSSGLSVTYS